MDGLVVVLFVLMMVMMMMLMLILDYCLFECVVAVVVGAGSVVVVLCVSVSCDLTTVWMRNYTQKLLLAVFITLMFLLSLGRSNGLTGWLELNGWL